MTPEKPRLDDLRIDHKPARKPASQINLALPTLLVLGIIWATVIGFVGGILPAIRAVRMPIAAALREL